MAAIENNRNFTLSLRLTLVDRQAPEKKKADLVHKDD